jgi:hypothetical protein
VPKQKKQMTYYGARPYLNSCDQAHPRVHAQKRWSEDVIFNPDFDDFDEDTKMMKFAHDKLANCVQTTKLITNRYGTKSKKLDLPVIW